MAPRSTFWNGGRSRAAARTTSPPSCAAPSTPDCSCRSFPSLGPGPSRSVSWPSRSRGKANCGRGSRRISEADRRGLPRRRARRPNGNSSQSCLPSAELVEIDLHLPELLLRTAVIDRTAPGDVAVAVPPDGKHADRESGIIPRMAALHGAANPLLAYQAESGRVEPGLHLSLI